MAKSDEKTMASSCGGAKESIRLPTLRKQSIFSKWKFRINLFLEQKGVLEVLKVRLKKKVRKREDFKRRDSEARCWIVQSVDDDLLDVVTGCKSAQEMIMKLEAQFQCKTAFSKYELKKQLLTMKLEASDSLQTHLKTFDGLISELEAIGCKLDESDKVCHLLLTLPEEYKVVITSLDVMMSLGTGRFFEFVKSQLLDTETRIKQKLTNSSNKENVRPASVHSNTSLRNNLIFESDIIIKTENEKSPEVPDPFVSSRTSKQSLRHIPLQDISTPMSQEPIQTTGVPNELPFTHRNTTLTSDHSDLNRDSHTFHPTEFKPMDLDPNASECQLEYRPVVNSPKHDSSIESSEAPAQNQDQTVIVNNDIKPTPKTAEADLDVTDDSLVSIKSEAEEPPQIMDCKVVLQDAAKTLLCVVCEQWYLTATELQNHRKEHDTVSEKTETDFESQRSKTELHRSYIGSEIESPYSSNTSESLIQLAVSGIQDIQINRAADRGFRKSGHDPPSYSVHQISQGNYHVEPSPQNNNQIESIPHMNNHVEPIPLINYHHEPTPTSLMNYHVEPITRINHLIEQISQESYHVKQARIPQASYPYKSISHTNYQFEPISQLNYQIEPIYPINYDIETHSQQSYYVGPMPHTNYHIEPAPRINYSGGSQTRLGTDLSTSYQETVKPSTHAPTLPEVSKTRNVNNLSQFTIPLTNTMHPIANDYDNVSTMKSNSTEANVQTDLDLDRLVRPTETNHSETSNSILLSNNFKTTESRQMQFNSHLSEGVSAEIQRFPGSVTRYNTSIAASSAPKNASGFDPVLCDNDNLIKPTVTQKERESDKAEKSQLSSRDTVFSNKSGGNSKKHAYRLPRNGFLAMSSMPAKASLPLTSSRPSKSASSLATAALAPKSSIPANNFPSSNSSLPPNSSLSLNSSTLSISHVFCKYCSNGFPNNHALDKHILLHIKEREKEFDCELCNKHFVHQQTYLCHIKDVHYGRKTVVSESTSHSTEGTQAHPGHSSTSSQPGSIVNLESNVENNKQLQTLIPKSCSIDSHNKVHGNLNDIIKYKRKQKLTCFCEFCGKGFQHITKLNNHMVVHTKERNFHCEICNKRFTLLTTLRGHVRTMHSGDKPYACKICEMRFTSTTFLKRHEQTHSGKKPFKCDVCGRGFLIKGTLKDHIGTHSDARPFKCKVCNKGFRREKYLERHEQVMHSDKKQSFACQTCGKSLTTRGGLLMHQAVHAEKSFICDHCGKGFAAKKRLINHLEVHAGQSFKCKICKKRFTRKLYLDRHKVTHGDRPYSCHICGQRFFYKNTLNRHMKTPHSTLSGPRRDRPPRN